MTDSSRIDLVAINIRSALNVGSLFRSADALGISKIWLAGYSATPDHEQVKKTALGAEKIVEWEKVVDPIVCLERLRAEGVRVTGLERTDAAKDLASYEPSFPCAIVVGNEVEGLSKMHMERCDDIVEIVQRGKKESLNVAVAAGIAIWRIRLPLDSSGIRRIRSGSADTYAETLHYHPHVERGRRASEHVRNSGPADV
jgi:23S rRNA (guanosine2251-2'-O)-methyltransferase